MKKLVSIILLLCLVCLSCTVYASEPPATEDASVNIKFETVKDENKITIRWSKRRLCNECFYVISI